MYFFSLKILSRQQSNKYDGLDFIARLGIPLFLTWILAMFDRVKKRKEISVGMEKWRENIITACLVGRKRTMKEKLVGKKIL